MIKIGISSGDPSGIGTEITAKALQFRKLSEQVVYIIYGAFQEFGSGNTIIPIASPDQANDPAKIYHIKIEDEVVVGIANKKAGKIAYEILKRISADLNSKKIDAVATCPISKKAIQMTHPDFVGHTEFFAQESNSQNVIMSFWGPFFQLALLTTHLPICEVGEALDKRVIKEKLRLLHAEFSRYLDHPKFAMLAVNPHGGEDGAFGNEDEMLAEVLEGLSEKEIKIEGPFPADTFFASHATKYDVVISAYHDQGLIPFKMLSSEQGVNVTLGLPYVRTSVDHGTAFDIAGKGIASEKSLIQAIDQAEMMLLKKDIDHSCNYSFFAEFYDEYMEHVPYAEWTQFILEQFQKIHNRKPKKVLELACGTANIATRFVKAGIEVDAADRSIEMLKIAAKKEFAPNLQNRKITAKFPENNYDLALLIYDSINYLLQLDEIKILLHNLHNSLKNKGLFIFDITTRKNCRRYFDGFLNIEDSLENYLVHQAEFSETENIHQTHFTFFQKKEYQYKRFDEVHRQRIFSVKELIEIIKKSNLQLIGIHSIGNEENLHKIDPKILDNNFSRLFFVLKK